MPDPRQGSDPSGLVAVGADLAPGTVLAAYRAGLFPMPFRKRSVGWWSPDPRGVIPLDGLRVSRSLRRSCQRYQVRVDTVFDQVITACGDPRREHGWINRSIVDAYTRLHALTKADNLGLALVVIGLLPQMDGLLAAAKLVLVWLLVLLSSAVVSQLIARAARRQDGGAR